MADDTTNYSDELSDLIKTDADSDVNLDYYTEDGGNVDQEDIDQIKTDILSILKLISKIDKDVTKLKSQMAVLGNKSVDKVLTQMTERLDRKANRSDLQVLHTRVDGFELFLKEAVDQEGVEKKEGESPVQQFVRGIIQNELTEFKKDILLRVNRVRRFVR